MDENHPAAVAERVPESDIDKVGDGYVLKSDPSLRVSARAHKMSKSRGNVVNPDDVVGRFGADSLRLYEMFMGPLRDTKVGAQGWRAGGEHKGAACSMLSSQQAAVRALHALARPAHATFL